MLLGGRLPQTANKGVSLANLRFQPHSPCTGTSCKPLLFNTLRLKRGRVGTRTMQTDSCVSCRNMSCRFQNIHGKFFHKCSRDLRRGMVFGYAGLLQDARPVHIMAAAYAHTSGPQSSGLRAASNRFSGVSWDYSSAVFSTPTTNAKPLFAGPGPFCE